MTEVVARPTRAATSVRLRGFTLIEVMITVAIIAILAAIAMPNYLDYITRGKLIEGTTAVSNARQRTEQIFLDTRDYTQSCPPAAAAEKPQNFAITCPGPTASTYTLTATAPVLGFTYTVDQNGNKTTVAVPAGWNLPNPNNCWAIRKSGACQ